MLVLSRDVAWIERLRRLAERGGWPVEASDKLAARDLSGPDRALVVLDRALAGAAPARAVAALRGAFATAAIVLACAEVELGADAVAAALSSGADDTIVKSWPDARLSARLSSLRDGALAAEVRASADGALKIDRRSRRAFVRAGGRWSALALTAPDFELLWRLLVREGEEVSRAELLHALKTAFGREVEVETVSRRVLALRRVLKTWKGRIESVRGGRYRLVSPRRRSTT
jgi:DNA-binding response OmpR family regulator